MGTIEQTAAVSGPTDADTATVVAAPTGRTSIRLLAFGLWGVVGALLAYGIVQTVVKAAALFGG